jgi:hypothetical protein
MSYRRRANVLGWLILLAGTAILLGNVIRGGRVLADGDVLDYYYPVKTLIRKLFLGRHSLAWNPFMGEGQPLAGNPEHELFYPFTWLIFAAPVRIALALSAVAHLSLMFGGMLRLLRRMRSSESAAIFGAVSWSFGGLVVSSMHIYPIFFGWTWIPWLCAVAARRSSSRVTLVEGGLFGGLLLLVGEPVTALLGALAFVAILISCRTISPRRLSTLAGAAILALGLGAASWIPGSALAGKTIRGLGLPPLEAAQRSFPLERTVEYLVPGAFGDVRPHSFALYQGWRFYSGSLWPFFWGIYSGALLLPLALAGLLSRRRRSLVLGGFAAFAFAVALGPPAGVWTLLRRIIPGATGVRFPEKFLALALFVGVILASRGLDEVRSRSGLGRRIAVAPFFIGALLALSGLLPIAWKPAAAAGNIREILEHAAFRHLALGSLLALIVWRPGRGIQKHALPLFLAAAAADVASASSMLTQSRAANWMDAPPPVVRQLLRVSPPPRLADYLPPEPPLLPNFVVEENGPFERNRVLYEQPVQWGIPIALDQDFDLTYLRPERRARYLINRVLLADHRAFAGLLAARHIGALLFWKSPVTLEDPVTVAGVAGVRPEVDSAESIVTFRGDEEFVRSALNSRIDLRRAAFVEGAPPVPEAEFSEASLSQVEIRDLEVSFESVAPGVSLTRIARTNDGNWIARVDGNPWPLLTVDISMIGIAVPPGRHHVVIRYRDPWLMAGMTVSGCSLAFLIAIASGSAARRSAGRIVRST